MDGLKYHIMPYLEETGVANINDSGDFCPKTYLISKYFELLNNMVISDMARPRQGASITRDHLSRASFMQYLISTY
jgi:hypothetical protein